MNTSINFKNFLTIMLAWLAINSSAYAATWNGGFTGAVYGGCDGLGKYVSFNHDGICKDSYNMSISLQRGPSAGGPFTTVVTQTQTSNLSSGLGDQMYFSGSVINQSGYYRVIISGTPIIGSSCPGSIGSYTSGASLFTITQTPLLNFNVNGTQQYTNIPGATYATVVGCAPINVNYTGSGSVTGYVYSYKEVTSTGVAIGSTYTSSPFTGAPTTISLSLATSKYYEITLEVSNVSCSASKTSRIYTNPTAPTASAAYKVNGITLASACSGTLPVFYSCAAFPMTLNNLSANVSEYLISLEKSSTACGTYTSVYNSGYISYLPTDLKNLPGTNGTYLQSNNGYYRVNVYGKNACGVLQSLATGYMNVAGAPTTNAAFVTRATTKSSGTAFLTGGCTVPYSTQLTYVSGGAASCGTGGIYTFPMESSNVANANPVGKSLTIFDLSSVGSILDDQVTIKSDIWNGSAWVNMNYLNVPETYNDLDAATLIGLLAEGDSDPSYPYYDYFATAVNGEIFRITITVTNACETKSQAQIIKLNTASLRMAAAGEEATEAQVASNTINVFPNPASSEVSFKVTTADKDKVNIAVYDLKGAHIMDVVTGAEATEGASTYRANLDHLTAGMYLYQVKVNNTVYTGKLSKQ